VKSDVDQESSDAQKEASTRSFVSMEYIAKQKARLVLLNAKAQRIGLSVHASVGNELHYGWWYLVEDGSGSTDKRVAAICNDLDDVDTFLAEKKRQAVKGQR
jgi:hypothetical protein